MSTYFNPQKDNKADYSDCPKSAREYLNYSLSIRGLSARTVNAYYIDLRTFLKYLVWYRGNMPTDTQIQNIDISDVDIDFLKKVTKAEIYEFLFYATQKRNNAAATRARKLSSLKGYFKYLTSKTGQLQHNPVDEIERPIQKKRLPKYLTLKESIELLENVQSDYIERDYCIITLLLNCGMRLSELVALNITSHKNDTLRVIGKGNKERIVYLNPACMQALIDYTASRQKLSNLRDKEALFVSKHTGNRLTSRRIQQIVNDCFKAAGLANKGYTVHKLRHTAATLLYQHGHVDLLSLKEILGHVDVSTTELYTHLESAHVKEAANASPLAKIKKTKQKT